MSSRVAIACLLGLLAAGCDRQGAAPEQAATPAPAPAPDEAPPAAAARPAAGAVDRSHKGEAAPTAAFDTPDGRATNLADFRGRPVLVNLWATWCAPCVAELPTLDALAKDGPVTVLAISQDMKPSDVAPFLRRRNVALKPYTNEAMTLSLALGANLPTTILYDAQGHEVWRVTGGMDWTSAEARALVAET